MAKATSLADSLGKHLECAVCLEQYTEPKVLPCLHSFCKRCLQGLLTEKGAVFKINCPTCRSSADVSFTVPKTSYSMFWEIIRADILLNARIFSRPWGARKNTTQLVKYPRILSPKGYLS